MDTQVHMKKAISETGFQNYSNILITTILTRTLENFLKIIF